MLPVVDVYYKDIFYGTGAGRDHINAAGAFAPAY